MKALAWNYKHIGLDRTKCNCRKGEACTVSKKEVSTKKEAFEFAKSLGEPRITIVYESGRKHTFKI